MLAKNLATVKNATKNNTIELRFKTSGNELPHNQNKKNLY